jgi:parallel beta-helix repeat protein
MPCGFFSVAHAHPRDVLNEPFLGSTIHVPTNYTTIQAAVDAASAGDTICVGAGTYYENVVVNKSNIKLQGYGANDTIVDGSGRETVFYIEASNVVVCGFTVRNCSTGVFLNNAFNCSVLDNHVMLNKFGIRLSFSSSCSIHRNNSTDNEYNIRLDYSSDNNLTRNVMNGSRYNFGVSGSSLGHYVQRIDDSNVANGKPICYIVNAENLTIDPQNYLNPGYLAVVNSSKITVKDFNISNNLQSALFAYTSDSTIENSMLVNNKIGIEFYHCSNCTVSRNVALYNMYHGILLGGSAQCVVYANNVTSNTEGIRLTYSTGCRFHGNTVYNNDCGIVLDSASGNEVFHNNIIDNTNQVSVTNSLSNLFDDGLEGNYWSDNSFQDIDQNGICDTPYPVATGIVDGYPLMGVYRNFRVTDQLSLDIVSNFAVRNVVVDQENKTLSCSLTGVIGVEGFCRVCVPKAFIDKPCIILTYNGTVIVINNTLLENSSHSWFYFKCSSPSSVTIIPELDLGIVLLFLIPITFIVIVSRQIKPNGAKS